MSTPENAVVVSIGEKTQIQSLDRTHENQPLSPGARFPADARLQAL